MLQLKRVLIRAAFNNGGEYDFSHWDQCSAAALLSLCFLNQIYTLYAPIVDHCLHHCFHEGQEKIILCVLKLQEHSLSQLFGTDYDVTAEYLSL